MTEVGGSDGWGLATCTGRPSEGDTGTPIALCAENRLLTPLWTSVVHHTAGTASTHGERLDARESFVREPPTNFVWVNHIYGPSWMR